MPIDPSRTMRLDSTRLDSHATRRRMNPIDYAIRSSQRESDTHTGRGEKVEAMSTRVDVRRNLKTDIFLKTVRRLAMHESVSTEWSKLKFEFGTLI